MAGDDVVNGLDGDDRLHGGAGNDQLFSGAGNDVVTGDAGDDLLRGGEGNDDLDGGEGDDELEGGDGADTLVGGTGNDVIDPGAGADYVEGGAGNDTLYGYAGDGADVYSFSAGWGADMLSTFDGDELRFDTGVQASDLGLWRAAVGDFLYDSLVVTHDASASSIWLHEFFGASPPTTIRFTFDTAPAWNYNDVLGRVRGVIGSEWDDTFSASSIGSELRGLGGNDRLTGSTGADVLDGGTGRDTLIGGAGNDTYVVDTAGETITESSGAGTDSVRSSISWTLGTNLENLELLGTSPINATGNSAANVLIGNSAANVLNGGSGADSMSGGAGDDTYVVDNVADMVTENADEGLDLVQSSVTFTLGANVENLTLTGTGAVNGTGNALANTIVGNSAGNTLNGGAGHDTLIGGAGNDTYVADDAGDVIIEAAGAGTDTVQTGLTWTLAAELENLTLTGSAAIDGTGLLYVNDAKNGGGKGVLYHRRSTNQNPYQPYSSISQWYNGGPGIQSLTDLANQAHYLLKIDMCFDRNFCGWDGGWDGSYNAHLLTGRTNGGTRYEGSDGRIYMGPG